jgi:hypothetical protein
MKSCCLPDPCVVVVAILVGGCSANRPLSTANSGGSTSLSGGIGSGGSAGAGGALDGGGVAESGGSAGDAGISGNAGSGTGGLADTGGRFATGGFAGAGTGGAIGLGGWTSGGGVVASGGSSGLGGSAGSGGTSAVGPCDIYQAAATPCVAAHSTVRALYQAYSGSLYQVRRASDGTTKDVPVASPGGFVDISVQDAFCSGTICTISILYDQSPSHNDLKKSPPALWLPGGGDEANASQAKISVAGRTAHGIFIDNPTANVAYRNNNTKGIATGDEPEAIYAVLEGKRYSTYCCFDYGNAETNGLDNGGGHMEALFWGAQTAYQMGGAGKGPWVGADFENGTFECDNPKVICTGNTSVTDWVFVTGMLKGFAGNHFALKAGNAQSGVLETKWDGMRPVGYSPMSKEGGIVLGTSGDGSNYGKGTFFEGCMTSGVPSDATDEAIQANIVAVGYGR